MKYSNSTGLFFRLCSFDNFGNVISLTLEKKKKKEKKKESLLDLEGTVDI